MMNEERIEYALRHIYNDGVLNPENKDENSVKNTIKYYLIDLADRQREEDMSSINLAFNKWDNTKSSGHGLDAVVDRIVNLIRNDITFSLREVGEKYRALINIVIK